MSYAEHSKLKKKYKVLVAKLERAELIEASLRADILHRTTEFMNQIEVSFALVDHILDPDQLEIRTLNAARKKWLEFKTVINESESAQAAIDSLGVDIVIHHGRNTKTIMDLWEQKK